MDKPSLRRHLQALRDAMPAQERADKSAQIVARLQTVIDWSSVESVHAFQPIASLGEVDIGSFNQSLKYQVLYPRKVAGEWLIDDGLIDVIIVPMLGFDDSLHRLGYGGGYYDRLLAAHPESYKLGVCFDLGKVEGLPVESHDIPLNTIITESAVYSSSTKTTQLDS